jgi:hypothetical protein
LTTVCTRNLSRGNFSNVIEFFKLKYVSDMFQQGDLGGNVSVKLCFDMFFNSIMSAHFVAGVKFSNLNFGNMFAIGM